MINLFPRFDYLRVIAAITLFDRLVDLENLDELLAEFTPVCVRLLDSATIMLLYKLM